MQLKKEKKYLSLLLLWFNTLTPSAIWKAEKLVRATLCSPSGMNKLSSVQYKSLWRVCNPCDSTALPCWEGNKRADGQETWVCLCVGSYSVLLVSGQWSILGTSSLRVQKARRYEKLSLFFPPMQSVWFRPRHTASAALVWWGGHECSLIRKNWKAHYFDAQIARKKVLTHYSLQIVHLG